ncbi:MAG: CCA tRNA nucleotidyltransferase [Candidatus Omnitrophica bacterium]|nr:CCA tRNA nucleotidyltransferase [Candidatus Omnitrophota bacterium]MDE2221859.1 CCA tRNA nucleotidyltransferase [Candidatus Omnitrophota bacterium]
MNDLLARLNKDSLSLVRSIGELAEVLGMRAYLVGGPVRDLVLKCANVDLDIAVEGAAPRLADGFARQQSGAAVTHYPAFKTATVRLADGRLVDFATARKETYARGGAFPAVVPSDIKHDLFRRDFTVNAMAVAVNPKAWGKVVDPFGGMKDLKAQRIRVLHDKSFWDDPTRILRAARFKARFGFKMEAKTLRLLKQAVGMKVLDTIRPQRYLKDFNKILQEPQSLEAVRCLKVWGAYKEGR